LLALLLGGVAIGFSPILVRLSDLAPLASGFWRLGLSVPILGLLALLTAPTARRGGVAFTRTDHLWAIAAGVAYGIDIACWHLALFYTSVTDATLIANLAPLVVTLSAIVLFSERPGPIYYLGFALSIAGAIALVLQKPVGAAPVDRLLGDLLAVGAAITYGAYMLIAGHLRQRHSAQTVVFYTTVVSAAIMLATTLWTGAALLPGSWIGWLVVLGIAVVSHSGGQMLIIYALGHLPASFSSMTQFIQTAVAALAAWIVLNEPLTVLKVLAAVAILAGIIICRAYPPRKAS
jgi:drug/metabolite transporter (DMT)-like permease